MPIFGALAAAAVALSPIAVGLPGAATPSCATIAGVDQVLAPGVAVLVGEIHGTEQSPAFVSALACQVLGAGYPVTVALEVPIEEEGRIDAFVASAGEDADRAALLAGPFWQDEPHDGRSSVAMAGLLESVRAMRSAGQPIDVVLLDEVSGAGDRERRLAEHLADAANANPDGIVIALTGNVHAMVHAGPDATTGFQPMGALAIELLGADRVFALDVVHSGGTAWVCTDTCGERAMNGSGSPDPAFAITAHLADASSGFHGEYSVGPITASPPAAG